MPNQVGSLCLVELVFIIAVFIWQQFEDLFLRLQPYAELALQLVLHLLEHFNQTIQEIHLSGSRMVPQQCTDTDVTTPLLDRLMWQEHANLLRRTHLQMQFPRILMQQQQGSSQRPRQNLVASQETATQTSPDQFGTLAESPAGSSYQRQEMLKREEDRQAAETYAAAAVVKAEAAAVAADAGYAAWKEAMIFAALEAERVSAYSTKSAGTPAALEVKRLEAVALEKAHTYATLEEKRAAAAVAMDKAQAAAVVTDLPSAASKADIVPAKQDKTKKKGIFGGMKTGFML